ncbi:4-hydroxybutyrate coenzyme A transferase [Echinococcus granulosus]|nr:4-hydroxybutyrate coenzyme A transferase [Echinococcus granulosus]
MLCYTNPRIMSATTLVGCPKMSFAAKTSSSWLGNLNYRRLFSLTLRYFTNTHEPSAPKPDHYPKWATSASEIFAELEDGQNIFMQGSVSTPAALETMLLSHVLDKKLRNLKLFQFYPLGPTPYFAEEFRGRIRMSTAYGSIYCRDAINEGLADYIPIALSDLPLFYRNKLVFFKYALIMVSPPDIHGFCTLGATVGSARSAIKSAEKIVAQVNPQVPVTYGDSAIHVSQIDFLVPCSEPIFEVPSPPPSSIDQTIASNIASELIEDGATIQLGFGSIPHEVTSHLRDHKDLGIHAENIFDGIVDLVELGVITNKHKQVRQGRIAASYAIGTKRVYDFIDQNPLVALYEIAWTNSIERIARNPKVSSVNTCLEMDLSGQSVGDSIAGNVYTVATVGETIDVPAG